MALALCLVVLPHYALAKMPRVVSLNICTDQLALRLATHGQLQGLSINASNPHFMGDAVSLSSMKFLRGDIEEILELKPDIVLMAEGQNPSLQNWLIAHKINVIALSTPTSLAALRLQIRGVADAIGEPDAAESIIQEQKTALENSSISEPAPSIAIYYARGFSEGTGSVMDDMLTTMGLHHVAREAGWENTHYVSLEEMVATAPDMLLIERYGFSAASEGEKLLMHPALAKTKAKKVVVPGYKIMCPHLFIGDIAHTIHATWKGEL